MVTDLISIDDYGSVFAATSEPESLADTLTHHAIPYEKGSVRKQIGLIHYLIPKWGNLTSNNNVVTINANGGDNYGENSNS